MIIVAKCSTESLIGLKTADDSGLSSSVTLITLKTFHGKFSNVRIVHAVSTKFQSITNDIISNLIKGLESSHLKVSIYDPTTFNAITNKSFVIIFINSLETFKSFQDKILFLGAQFEKFYLLVLVNGTFKELQEIVQSFWKFWIYNINVVVQQKNGKNYLLTFFPYTDKSCGGDTNLQVINQFDTKTLKWNSENFYPEKFETFSNCKVKIGALKSFAPSAIVEKFESETKFSGFEVDIFEAISKIYNYSCNFKDFANGGVVSRNSSNNTDLLQSVYNGKTDVAIGGFSLQLARTLYLSETRSFLSVPIIIVVPPPAQISPFRKLYLPFTITVWALFLSIFVGSWLVLMILSLKFKNAYKILVGDNVSTPFLNMLDTFFNGCQYVLPTETFARFVVMNFIIFCLVTRSLYQAQLFNIMQVDMRENMLNTIDEMMEKKITFYAYEALGRRLQDFKFFNR